MKVGDRVEIEGLPGQRRLSRHIVKRLLDDDAGHGMRACIMVGTSLTDPDVIVLDTGSFKVRVLRPYRKKDAQARA